MKKGAVAFEIHSLKHHYGLGPVLEIDRLSIAGGAITGLVGPNGSGKSTLLRLLGCIERPAEGRIHFNGTEIKPFSEAGRFLITLLPQEPFLMKRSVFANVAYGLKLRGEKEGLTDRVRMALDLVGLPAVRFAQRPWFALSGGEAQRVALAARLVLNPKVLLMDEPTASVDAASAERIKEAALRASQEWGTTLVVASHDRQWLHEVCDEVIHLYRGRIFGTGHDTLVFGPWVEEPEGRWFKRLADGRRLVVSPPPDPDSVAVIRFSGVDGLPDSSGYRTIDQRARGTVSRLNLEKRTGRIVATITSGDIALTVVLTERQCHDRRIFPGQPLEAGYRIDEIAWI
ncbi:MAG: energy-coupling factor ABC transporter ATP-binding protein [Desulfobacterales bacterium]